MFISMVRSEICKQKKECFKKSSEMIWKMPEKILINKKTKRTRENIIMLNLLTSMHE